MTATISPTTSTATSTTTSTSSTSFIDVIDRSVDDDFAMGAARYLRRAGLDTAAIASAIADELDLTPADAERFARAA